MMHSFKFGVVAMVTVFGGGSFYLGTAETPAFAQATTGSATGQSVTTGTTTTGATAQPQRRVNRPRPGGASGTDVRGGPGRQGTPTTADPVPLSAAECAEVGGTVGVSQQVCRQTNGNVCNIQTRDPNRPGWTISRDVCINE